MRPFHGGSGASRRPPPAPLQESPQRACRKGFWEGLRGVGKHWVSTEFARLASWPSCFPSSAGRGLWTQPGPPGCPAPCCQGPWGQHSRSLPVLGRRCKQQLSFRGTQRATQQLWEKEPNQPVFSAAAKNSGEAEAEASPSSGRMREEHHTNAQVCPPLPERLKFICHSQGFPERHQGNKTFCLARKTLILQVPVDNRKVLPPPSALVDLLTAHK